MHAGYMQGSPKGSIEAPGQYFRHHLRVYLSFTTLGHWY